jgi:hypothetical protein
MCIQVGQLPVRMPLRGRGAGRHCCAAQSRTVPEQGSGSFSASDGESRTPNARQNRRGPGTPTAMPRGRGGDSGRRHADGEVPGGAAALHASNRPWPSFQPPTARRRHPPSGHVRRPSRPQLTSGSADVNALTEARASVHSVRSTISRHRRITVAWIAQVLLSQHG